MKTRTDRERMERWTESIFISANPQSYHLDFVNDAQFLPDDIVTTETFISPITQTTNRYDSLVSWSPRSESSMCLFLN